MSDSSPPDQPGSVQDRLRAARLSDAELWARQRLLKQEHAQATQQFKATRDSIQEMWERLVRARNGGSLDRDLRHAALNLLEDTQIARLGEEKQAAGRERAEAAGLESEARYRSLFESIDQAFCIIEVLFGEGSETVVDYRFLEVNPAFEHHTGLANAVGHTMRELAPGHEEQWFQIYGRIAHTGEPARFECRVEKLGRDFDIYAFRTGELREHRVAVLFTNITERKRREANLAFLADVSQDLVRVAQIQDIMQALTAKVGAYFSASLCEFSMISEDAETMTTVHAWSKTGKTGERPIREDHSEAFVRVSQAGEAYVVRDAQDDPALQQVGAFLSVPLVHEGAWRFSLSLADTNPRTWRDDEIEMLREITLRIWTRLDRARAEDALRETQEHLRLIMENAREYGIITADLERRITSWNPGAEQIFGYRAEEAVGQSLDMTFIPEDRDAGVCGQEAELALSQGRASEERWHLRKNGTRFWVSGVVMAMRDGEGHPMGFVKILRDHTEARRAAEAMARSKEEAEAANQAKDQFLAVLSHELRTPLTPVLLVAGDLATNEKLPQRTRDAMGMIHRNIELEARLIDDLLDITRITRGKVEINVQSMDLHETVSAAVKICAREIEEKKQTLTVHLRAKDATLQGDPQRLQQVFWNLLKNASKFTAKNGTIKVASKTEKGRIMVRISDTGVGIRPELLGKIFHPFEQGDAAGSRTYGGLGLGLAIAKATVDAHGGELLAESDGPNQGATFTVKLPL